MYLTAPSTLITYTSIIHFTQAGVLSTNTVNLAQLHCYILNREKIKTSILCLKLSKTKSKNRSNFLDKCLILHCLFKIMFGAGAEPLFARYFQKDKSQFSQCAVQVIYTTCDKLGFFCYKLSTFLAIIDGYYIWLPSDWTI